jgi:predicted dehydrogenase
MAEAREKIRVGFIGRGGIMSGHVYRLKNSADDLVALADPRRTADWRFGLRSP